MCGKFKRRIFFGAFIIATLFLSSCKQHGPSTTRIDLSDAVEYLETPPDYFVGDIMRLQNEFKPLEKKNMTNLKGLLKNKDNYLWLRIRFDLPKNMQNTDLGLFIGYICTADRAWINYNSVRTYGNFPPNSLSAGYQAQYFMFPRTILRQNETNTVLIQLWTGISVSMSEQIFLGSQMQVYNIAERRSFFTSKIYLCFATLLLLIFILYMFLAFCMRKQDEWRSYIHFGILSLYSIGFLVPFFLAEIPWAKPIFIDNLFIVKWCMCMGAYTCVYFSSSFLTNWLRYKESKKTIYIRLAIWLISVIGTGGLPTQDQVVSFSKYCFTISLGQFAFCIPNLVRAFKDNTRRTLAVQALFGFSPAVIGLILDGIFRIGMHNRDLPFFTLYGWQLALYIYLFYLMARFSSMYVRSKELKEQLSEFNAHLEDVVALRTKELSETNFVLSRGLETVAHVQKNFLPKKEKLFKGWEIAIGYKALDNDVSGDLYDYYYTEQILNGFGIFDVSGHGIPAGLMTILAKSIISQHFLSGLAKNQNMTDVLLKINEAYIKEKSNVENYITGVLLHFKKINKADEIEVELANAGHPAPLLFTQKTGEVTELKYEDANEQYGILGVEGLPVSFPSVSCSLAVGDVIVCFTDGITEAFNSEDEEFGKDRLAEVIKSVADKSALEIKQAIIEAYQDFIDTKKPFDDVTFAVLKRTPSKDFIEEI